jgi:hypothetical protein
MILCIHILDKSLEAFHINSIKIGANAFMKVVANHYICVIQMRYGILGRGLGPRFLPILQ